MLTKAVTMPLIEGMSMGLATKATAPMDQRMVTRPANIGYQELQSVPSPDLAFKLAAPLDNVAMRQHGFLHYDPLNTTNG